MINIIRKCLLTLTITLLTGYSHMHAGPGRSIVQHDLIHIFKQSVQTDNRQNRPAGSANRYEATIVGRTQNKIISEENEEGSYKPPFFNAYVSNSAHYPSSGTQTKDPFIFKLASRLPSCAHWFYASSHRNIILRVIRI